MSAQVTFNQALDSLTGFEELAIVKAFDSDINTLLETRATFAGRALVFTDLTRQGQSEKDAKQGAMSMTLAEVNGYFADDEEEPFPEEPVTEAGKGDAQPS